MRPARRTKRPASADIARGTGPCVEADPSARTPRHRTIPSAARPPHSATPPVRSVYASRHSTQTEVRPVPEPWTLAPVPASVATMARQAFRARAERLAGHRRHARGHGRQSPRLWYRADFGLRRVPTRVHAPDWRGSAVRGPCRGGDRPVARRASRRIRLDARSCSPGNIGRRWSLRPSRGSHGPRLVRAPGRGAVRRDGRGYGWAPLGVVSARSLLTTGSRYISS